jgi:shikimate dehydrogenase
VIRLGVCGWPVGHSRSPAMHNAALAAAGLDGWRYQHLPIPPELFAETVRALPEAGFRGVNVTVPHKEAALALADDATDSARAIGAANTLTFANGLIHADNTDAPGLLDVLPRSPAGATALVLGAGGAARAAVWALKQAGAAEVRLFNRTPERAAALAAELGAIAVSTSAPADILVNCTTVGLESAENPFKALSLRADDWGAGTLVVDMVYRRGGTHLYRTAQANGAEVVGGLEVLVAQGAASFERWTGRTAPRQAMREAVADIAQ